MKKTILYFLTGALCFSSWISCAGSGQKITKVAAQVSKSKDTEIQHPIDIGPNRSHQWLELENGLKILLVPDDRLPKFHLMMMTRVGSVNDPIHLPGLNHFALQLLEKGSLKSSAEQIANRFADMGTDLSVSPGEEYSVFSADSLAIHQEALLEVFAEVITQGSFRDDEIRKLKSLIIAGIKKKSDNPRSLIAEKFDQFIFRDHPYGRPLSGTVESINKVTKSDLIKHYLTWVRPNQSVLAVVGKFEKNIVDRVKFYFGGWTSRPAPKFELDDFADQSGRRFGLYEKQGQTQAQIIIGQRGLARKNEDYLKARLFENLMGGFGSKLMKRVRSELGLTYSISSNFSFPIKKGIFTISTFTKSESLAQTILEIEKVLQDIKKNGFIEEDLEAAKNQLLANFPRALESSYAYAWNLLYLHVNSVSDDYLKSFAGKVRSISLSEMNDFAKSFLDIDNMKTLVLGDSVTLRPQLKTLSVNIESLK